MRVFLFLIALLSTTLAIAAEDSLPPASRLSFSILSSTGVVGTERGCPNAVANFYQLGTDAGTLYGCDEKGETDPSANCDSLGVFSATSSSSGTTIKTGKPWFVFNATAANGVGESVLTLTCSNTQIGDTGGGATHVVNNEAEMNAILDTLDGSERVTATIQFSENFDTESSSISSFNINLPELTYANQSDNSTITIDFNGQSVHRNASTIVAINPNNGHDLDLILRNGTIGPTEASVHDACVAAPTVNCDRNGIEWVDTGSGTGYRLLLDRMDIGPTLCVGSGCGAVRTLAYPRDACFFNSDPNQGTLTRIAVHGGQWECETGMWIGERGTTDTSVLSNRDFDIRALRWQQSSANRLYTSSTSCLACDTGFFNFTQDFSGNIFGNFTLQNNATLGTMRGGNLNLSLLLRGEDSAFEDCHSGDRGDNSYFLRSSGTNGILTGYVKAVGGLCTRGWIAVGKARGLRMDVKLDNQPGFLASDTELGATARLGAVDYSGGVSPSVGEVYLNFDLGEPPTSLTDIDYEDLIDASGLNTVSSERIHVDLGSSGYSVLRATASGMEVPFVYTIGRLQGEPVVEGHTGATVTLTGSVLYGGHVHAYNTGDDTFTLPHATTGMSMCLWDTWDGGGTNGMTLDIDGSDYVALDGVFGSAGQGITTNGSGALGDYVCLFATSDYVWRTRDLAGSWSLN